MTRKQIRIIKSKERISASDKNREKRQKTQLRKINKTKLQESVKLSKV